MNKPIIIDGVDVSECENYFHIGNEENCEDYLDGVCQGHNCLYKQLQRLKAENEQYKQALEEIQNVLFPKNKLLITDCKGLLKTQEILNEVLKDEK